MVRIYWGEDSYASYSAALEKAAELAKAKHRVVNVIDADDIEVADLQQQLEGVSLFYAPAVIVAKRLLENKVAQEYISRVTDRQDIELIIWHPGKVDQRTAIIKDLKKKKLAKESPAQKPWEVEKWVETQLRNRKVPTSKEISSILTEYTAGDKWRLIQELNKLELYSQARPGNISAADVKTLIGTDISGDIWEYLDALGAGNKRAALAQLKKLLSLEGNDQFLLSMLVRELSILNQVWHSQQLGISISKLKHHPFVLEKAQKKITKFSGAKLRKLTHALFRLDFGVKQGRLDFQSAILLYTLSW